MYIELYLRSFIMSVFIINSLKKANSQSSHQYQMTPESFYSPVNYYVSPNRLTHRYQLNTILDDRAFLNDDFEFRVSTNYETELTTNDYDFGIQDITRTRYYLINQPLEGYIS